jgi:hypothetical protein
MTRKAVKLDPTTAGAAQLFAAELGVVPTGSDGRIGCAYGACDRRFTPNSCGKYAHTGCPAGSAAYKLAYPKGRDHMTADAVHAAGPGWVARWAAAVEAAKA